MAGRQLRMHTTTNAQYHFEMRLACWQLLTGECIILFFAAHTYSFFIAAFRKEKEMQERTGAAAPTVPAPTPATQMVQKTESGKYEETRIQVQYTIR